MANRRTRQQLPPPEAGKIVLPCYRTRQASGLRLLVYTCPWCGRTHTHGDTGGAIEMRGSHCLPHECPTAGRGIVLVPVGTLKPTTSRRSRSTTGGCR